MELKSGGQKAVAESCSYTKEHTLPAREEPFTPVSPAVVTVPLFINPLSN